MSRCCHRSYGCLAFLFDIFMCVITTALLGFPVWLIWIFVREFRRQPCRCY